MKELNPKLRPDLIKHEHEDSKGARSFVLEDPVANKFYRVSAYEYNLLGILDGKLSLVEAMDELRLRGHHYTQDYAKKLVEQFSMAGLLLGTGYGSSRVQTALKNRMEGELKSRTPFKLYFMYIPVLNPDNFLEKTLWIWRLIANRITLAIFLALVPGAIYLLVSGIHRLQGQFLYFFNFANLLALWIAIALVKLIHEFAHAYTAKSYGLRVPEMGVAFLIFFPCLYCNTTAAWQLGDRRQRMNIALAGIVSEAVVAVICAYLWYFSKPGLLNSVAFYLTVISLLSSVLFNGNPLLKFDGYFVLTDLLRITNLQAKSFNALKYLFQNRVLGMGSIAMPESSSRDKSIFVVYGILAFLYRFILYTGIVAGVYFKFDKTMGILLGALALMLFVIRPVTKAVVNLGKRRAEMNYRKSGIIVFVCIVAAVTFLLTRPLSDNSVYPCYLDSALSHKLVIPADAPVGEVFVRQDEIVDEGQVLFRLDPTRLEYSLKEKEIQLKLVEKEISITENIEKERSRLPLKRIELSQAVDAIKQTKEYLGSIESKAPFRGAITRLAPNFQPGANPGKGVEVGELASQTVCEVVGMAPEHDVSSLEAGSKVTAWFPVGVGESFTLTVREVTPFKAEDLEGSPLSSRFGGEIATEAKEESSKDSPLEPQYLCKMDFQNVKGIPLGMTGRLVVQKPPRSVLRRFVDKIYRTFNREIIF